MNTCNPSQTATAMPLVQHNTAAQRFELPLHDGSLAMATYRMQGHTMVMDHTEVPPAGQGQGVAAKVVQAALAHAREQGLKVQPSCSYVAAYIQRHPQEHDLLAS